MCLSTTSAPAGAGAPDPAPVPPAPTRTIHAAGNPIIADGSLYTADAARAGTRGVRRRGGVARGDGVAGGRGPAGDRDGQRERDRGLGVRPGPASGPAARATCTQPDGAYWLGQVQPGSYSVAYTDPSAVYVTRWWTGSGGGAAGYAGAVPITVVAGETRANVGAQPVEDAARWVPASG